MAPLRRKATNYIVKWVNGNRQLVIRPKRYAPSDTPIFGLGNATIRLDMNNLPKKVLKKITGETTNTKLVPVLPTRLHRWTVSLSSMNWVVKDITGFNGSTAKFKYFEAADFEMHHHEVASRVMVEDKITVTMPSGVATWIMRDEGYGPMYPLIRNSHNIIALQAAGGIDKWVELWDYGVFGQLLVQQKGKVVGYMADSSSDNITKIYEIGEDGNHEVPVEVALDDVPKDYMSLSYGQKRFGYFRFSDGTVRRRSHWYPMPWFDPPYYDEEVKIVDTNVARLTRWGRYYYTGEYYKAGPGNTAVIPFLSDGKGNDFILSVFEGYEGDAIVTLENGQIRVSGSNGITGTLPIGIKIDSVFETDDKVFVATGSYGDYKVYDLKEGSVFAKCEDFGVIKIYHSPARSAIGWGYESSPVGGRNEFGKYATQINIEVKSGWSTTGNKPGVGSVVGGDVYKNGDDLCLWKITAPGNVSTLKLFRHKVCPFYIKDGKTHILVEKNIEANISIADNPEDGYAKLYSKSVPHHILLHKENASNVAPGGFIPPIALDERPQVTYNKDNVSDLYFRFA